MYSFRVECEKCKHILWEKDIHKTSFPEKKLYLVNRKLLTKTNKPCPECLSKGTILYSHSHSVNGNLVYMVKNRNVPKIEIENFVENQFTAHKEREKNQPHLYGPGTLYTVIAALLLLLLITQLSGLIL